MKCVLRVMALGARLFILMGLVAGTAAAQGGTAAISGRVIDPQGLALPGVVVTLTNALTRDARQVSTNGQGHYLLRALPPGRYTLTFELDGFASLVIEDLTLLVGAEARQDAQLAVGGVTGAVTVEGTLTALTTTTAAVGNNISEATIRNLPVEAANVLHLLSLQPGAVFIPTTDPETTDPRYGAVAGARSDQQTVTLDGVDVSDPQLQTAFTSVIRVTREALQEIRVSTANHGAEFGRSSGPQISLVTKSGTNAFDGSAYWLLRRTATSTNEYFLELAQLEAGEPSVPPKLDKDIYGGSIGGPIRRDRAFFFANYERLEQQREQPSLRNVPSMAFRDGVLQYPCAVPSACPGGAALGFTGTHDIDPGWFGLTPAQIATLDPLALGPNVAASHYFRQYPVPNEPGIDGRNLVGYRFPAPIEDTFNTFIARLDLRPSTNRSLFGRIGFQDDTTNSAPSFPGQPAASRIVSRNRGLALGWDEVLGASLVNSFRYGFTEIDASTTGGERGSWVSFAQLSAYESVNATTSRKTPTHNIVDDMSWLKGAHAVKFGVNLRFTRIPSSRNARSTQNAFVDPQWVAGGGLVYRPQGPQCTTPGCALYPAVASTFFSSYASSWLNMLGVLSNAVRFVNYDRAGNALPIGEPVTRRYASNEYELYVQDTWQAASNLTVTYGVRYSLDSPPWEVNGLQVAPQISMGEWFDQRVGNMRAGIPSNQSEIITFDLAGPANGRRGFYDWDTNNFAPRVAIAWTPTDRWVVRGGYSKVFDRIGHGLAERFDSGASFGMSTSLSSPRFLAYETIPEVRFVDSHTVPPTVPAPPPGGFPQTPPLASGIITSSIDDTIVTPSAHTVSAVVGHELGRGFTVEAGYVGRFGRDQLIRRDIAMPLNLVDTVSGMDYFTAAQQLILATQAAGIAPGSPASAYSVLGPIPYWENLFPNAATAALTATQRMARRYNDLAPDYITALYEADQFCFPACSTFGPFSYFAQQYDALAALSSIGRSNYNSLVLTVRKRYSQGYQFDVNYTLSRSRDMGSQSERGPGFFDYRPGGYSGFLINSFEPELNYGVSDFDVTHQINANGIWDLPFGQGRRWGAHARGWMNALIGDWAAAGILRWTSGFPFSVINCQSCWTTNWNLQGNATLVDPDEKPATSVVPGAIDGRPSVFLDPDEAGGYFRFSLPGESGDRNPLRGDGYFVIDLGVSKTWRLPFGGHRMRFRWDVFNVTNHVSFDVGRLRLVGPGEPGFGRYDGALATCDARAGRCMQFAFRYEF